MNATTKAEQNALTLPQRAAVALGTAEHEVKLRELVKSSTDIVAVIDPAGREQAHRIGMTLKTARVAIEKTGKAAREDAQAFAKAVIAEEKRLVEIVTEEETRVFGLRDAYDAKVEAERQAKIAAERARIEAIKKDIAEIHDVAIGMVGKTTSEIDAAISQLETIDATEERFAEFAPDAQRVLVDTAEKLMIMYQAALTAENAAAEAKRLQIAEEARIAAEREELARLRAEQAERERLAKIDAERVAAEQAAEAQRQAAAAAAQQAETARIRAQAEENLRAERAAMEEQMRAERERVQAEQAERDRVAADVKRQLEEQQAAIAEERAALVREQAEAAKRAAAAVQLDADHAEALALNATFDAERVSADERDQEPVLVLGQTSSEFTTLKDFVQATQSNSTHFRVVSDEQIFDAMIETFGYSRADAIERLAEINFATAREAA